MKKIKDLFVAQKMREEYNEFLNMSLSEFVDMYEEMDCPQKSLEELYNNCKSVMLVRNPQNRKEQLNVVPISLIETLKIGNRNIPNCILSCLKEFGCNNLADVSEIQPYAIEEALGNKRKAIYQSNELLKLIQSAPDQILEIWDSVRPVVLPEQYDNAAYAIPQLLSILPSLTKILSEQKKKVMSDVIRMYCLENKSKEDIRIAMGMKNDENVLGHIRRFSYGITDGSILVGRYSFHSEFLSKLNSEICQLLYSDFNTLSFSINNEAALAILGLSPENISADNYQLNTPIILRDISKSRLTVIAKLFTQLLKSACYPIPKERLWEEFDANTEQYAIENKRKLFESLLKYHSAVESNDECYWLKGELLSKYQKIARIVYENRPNPISKEDAISIFNRLYPSERIENINTGDIHSKETGVNFIGKIGQLIYGDPMPSLRQAIGELLDQSDDIVMFGDLKKTLTDQGYTVNEDSLKSYLSYFGYLYDLDEKTRFCHKDKVSDYPKYRWSKSKKYGVQNKAINLLKESIEKEKTHSISIDKARKLIREWCTSNEIVFHSLMYAIEKKYIDSTKREGDDAKPFYLKEQDIFINESFKDWAAIGLSGKYRAFEVYAYGLTFEFLRQSGEKRLQVSVLADKLLKWAKSNLPDLDISDSTIRRFFNEDALPEELQRETEDNGDVYIFEKEPSQLQVVDDDNLQYVIDNKQDIDQKADVRLVVADVSNRPQVTYTETFNWARIIEVLPRELSYHTRFYPKLLDSCTIEKFQKFLEGSTNNFLNEVVPQDLYEYWFARTNYSLNRRYLSDLARCFESLLKDIYQRQKKKNPQTKSLTDICELGFTEFYPICLSSRKAGTPIEKIFADLHFKRNKEAHGEYLEMSSANIAKCILDYTVLYIYVIDKYA